MIGQCWGTGDVVPNNIRGTTSTINTEELCPVSEPLATLIDPLTPAKLTYTITPYANGCPGVVLIDSVVVKSAEFDFFVPAVITPNGNGQNDYWKFAGGTTSLPAEYVVDIFNRSGGLVYTLPSLDHYWEAPNLIDGTYWYILKRKSDDAVVQKGGLRIKRD